MQSVSALKSNSGPRGCVSAQVRLRDHIAACSESAVVTGACHELSSFLAESRGVGKMGRRQAALRRCMLKDWYKI